MAIISVYVDDRIAETIEYVAKQMGLPKSVYVKMLIYNDLDRRGFLKQESLEGGRSE